ncbi:hypothetical protein VE01_05919 [Pseudogymnoascus verrucosus]|uniref:Thioesterase domain-containing protein n=1 Tax=Pseudogymnoascus verrucosus TaxID=342668 RepID=A0A1B8GIE6_9PEZI|nr:uncharacterized protein VE01_05919 [Pseudogymnoascus verrucosus]OBT95575.1 hypothetical protein VE01_05919 [Pseudogymnoascus verrucosus]
MDENPSLVQEARNRRASSIPVVLIHDGGGTAFGYYILGELHPARELWAIRNPDYNRSKPYSMTMEEMARNYIRMIESSGIRGPIYLGGWSLGGLLSVVMANEISKSTTPVSFSLAGILLIESPFYSPKSECPPVRTVDFSHLPEHIRNCLSSCMVMLEEWSMPTTGPEGWLPPAVLIRSTQRMVAGPGESNELPARVDLRRDDKILGWGLIGQEFIIGTLDVESNHYNIFDMNKIEEVTWAINRALQMLDASRGIGILT